MNKSNLKLRRLILLLITAAAALLLASRVPKFLTFYNLMNVVKQTSIIAIPAIAMTMVMIIKGIDLSTSGLISFVPMAMIVMFLGGVPFALCVPIVLVAGVLIGLLDGWIIAKIGVPPFISTLVFGSITSGLALVLGNGGSVGGFPRYFTKLGSGTIFSIPYCNLILVGFTIVGALLLSSTRFGNWVYALGNNEQVVKQEGINTDRITISVFGISAFCCSVAGLMLSAQMATAHPLQGVPYQLDCIAACILGGVSMFGGEGKVLNSVLGALIIGALRNILNLLRIHPFMQNLILGITIIVIVAVSTLVKQRKQRYAYSM